MKNLNELRSEFDKTFTLDPALSGFVVNFHDDVDSELDCDYGNLQDNLIEQNFDFQKWSEVLDLENLSQNIKKTELFTSRLAQPNFSEVGLENEASG